MGREGDPAPVNERALHENLERSLECEPQRHGDTEKSYVTGIYRINGMISSMTVVLKTIFWFLIIIADIAGSGFISVLSGGWWYYPIPYSLSL